jgi:multidrug efflux pump subunit AcrA (membrane-fusion protein)
MTSRAFLVVLVAILGGCTPRSEPSSGIEDAVSEEELSPIGRPIPVHQLESHPGVLLARTRHDLVAPATGSVRGLEVEVGAQVEVGHRLFRIDAAAQRTRKDALGRRRRESESIERWISASDVRTAQEEVHEAEAELQAAASERRAAEVEQRLADDRIDALSIVADAPLKVAGLYVDDGAHVVEGQPIVRVLSTGPVELHFAVPEREASRLSVGGTVRWRRASSEGELREARVSTIAPEVDARSGLVFVEAALGDAHGVSLSGASVDVFIVR